MSDLAVKLDEARAVVERLERQAQTATCAELGRHARVSTGDATLVATTVALAQSRSIVARDVGITIMARTPRLSIFATNALSNEPGVPDRIARYNLKKILILGAYGFLGQQLEYRLKADGHFVVSAGRGRPKYRKSIADEIHVVDLRDEKMTHVLTARHEFDEVYALAGDVGGLGHIATGEHDAEIMTNSTRINLAVLNAARRTNPGKIFFASSQCVYPDFDRGIDPFAQERLASEIDLMPRTCRESDASFNTFAFAQEKLYAERLFLAYAKSYGLSVRIARISNTYGPYCTYDGPRAKSVAAICRKVAQAKYSGVIRLWGDGTATRSFTYVDDAVEGMIRLMASDYQKPVNIAHAKPVSIVELFETICKVAGKVMAWEPEPGPVGNASRTSDNTLCRQVLNWEPDTSLYDGLLKTYPWIAKQALTPSFKLTTL